MIALDTARAVTLMRAMLALFATLCEIARASVLERLVTLEWLIVVLAVRVRAATRENAAEGLIAPVMMRASALARLMVAVGGCAALIVRVRAASRAMLALFPVVCVLAREAACARPAALVAPILPANVREWVAARSVALLCAIELLMPRGKLVLAAIISTAPITQSIAALRVPLIVVEDAPASLYSVEILVTSPAVPTVLFNDIRVSPEPTEKVLCRCVAPPITIDVAATPVTVTLGISVSDAPVSALAKSPIADAPLEPVLCPVMRMAVAVEATTVVPNEIVIAVDVGLADCAYQHDRLHWFCVSCRSNILVNVAPNPVTPEGCTVPRLPI